MRWYGRIPIISRRKTKKTHYHFRNKRIIFLWLILSDKSRRKWHARHAKLLFIAIKGPDVEYESTTTYRLLSSFTIIIVEWSKWLPWQSSDELTFPAVVQNTEWFYPEILIKYFVRFQIITNFSQYLKSTFSREKRNPLSHFRYFECSGWIFGHFHQFKNSQTSNLG